MSNTKVVFKFGLFSWYIVLNRTEIKLKRNFVKTISWFIGEAVYPPEPAEGYGANKYVAKGKGYGPPPPKYAPA